MKASVVGVAALVATCVFLLLAMTLAGSTGVFAAALLGSLTGLILVRSRLGNDAPPVTRPAAAPPRPVEPFHRYRRIVFFVLWNAGRGNPYACRFVARLAEARLDQRHGISLCRDPADAAHLLGARAWALLDPADDSLFDRDPNAWSRADIEHVVERLEGL